MNSILDGLRVAEDLCIDVLRDLSFPTKDALQEVSVLEALHGLSSRRHGLINKKHRGQQQYTSQGGDFFRILTGLAAGLQHSVSDSCHALEIPKKEQGRCHSQSNPLQMETFDESFHINTKTHLLTLFSTVTSITYYPVIQR